MTSNEDGVPSAKKIRYQMCGGHTFLSQSCKSSVFMYMQSKYKLAMHLRIPHDVLLYQISDGHLLDQEIVDLLFEAILSERDRKVVCSYGSILEQNYELHFQRLSCSECEIDELSAARFSTLPCYWWNYVDACLTLLLQHVQCSGSSKWPFGSHWLLVHCIKWLELCVKWSDSCKSHSVCRKILQDGLELMLILVKLESEGQPFDEPTDITSICSSVVKLITFLTKLTTLNEEITIAVMRVIGLLTNFTSQRAFILHLMSCPMVCKEVIHQVLCQFDMIGEESQPVEQSLEYTLNVHFNRIPHYKSHNTALAIKSTCNYFVMLLCYLVELQADGMNMEKTESQAVSFKRALGTALGRLTEHLSEDAQLVMQLSDPTCWFYMSYLTLLSAA